VNRPPFQTAFPAERPTGTSGGVRRRPNPPTFAFVWALAALGGCQSFESRPLDPNAHQEAWDRRTLDGASLEEFMSRRAPLPSELATDFDPQDGLSLGEGRLVALVYNPTLRLARLRVERTAAGAAHSGSAVDPSLEFSALRATDGGSDPWVIAAGLGFSIPLGGRRAAERDLAEAELRAQKGAFLESEWTVWRDVGVAWIEWSAARLRVDATERLARGLEGLARTAMDLADRGELASTEAALFRIEQAQRNNQLRRLRGEVEAAKLRLLGLVGLPPATLLELLPAIELETTIVAIAPAGPDAIALRNPELARLRREYDVAEAALRHAIRKQYPDLTLGPLFESDAGRSRIGLLGGIPLPLLNANRREIAEARVEREIARAAVETAFESLVGGWAVAVARAQALAGQREELVQVLAPLMDRQVEDAFEMLRLGESASTLVLLESLTRAFQAKLDLIDIRAAEAIARAEIVYVIGPANTAAVSHMPEDRR